MIMQQLAHIRKEKSIKQGTAAAGLGTGQKRLSQVERGLHSPSVEFASKYADYLGYELKLVKKG